MQVSERKMLPETRNSVTHKFSVGGHEGYLIVGLYDDGKPGEIFVHMSKEGSTMSGLINAIAVSVSLALQYGVPLSEFVRKFKHTSFEPSGYTNNPDLKVATSILDYLFSWLESKFEGVDKVG